MNQESLTPGNADQVAVVWQYTDKLKSDLDGINKIINAPGRSTLYRSMFESIPMNPLIIPIHPVSKPQTIIQDWFSENGLQINT